MASALKKDFIFLLLIATISFSLQIHARESHFFNKVSSTDDQKTPSSVTPQQQEPSFTLESDNNGHGLYGHDLYGHEYGQLSPSTGAASNGRQSYPTGAAGIPNKKYLPKNYNPVAYVTVAEDDTGAKDSSFPTEETSFIGEEVPAGASAGKDSKFQAGEAMFDDKEFTPTTSADNYQYVPENEIAGDGDSNGYYFTNRKSSMPEDKFSETDFNTQQEDTFPTTTTGAGETRFNYNNRGVAGNWVQQQGMSDTRFLENGKYFYDVNTEKYTRTPLENAKDLAGISRNQFKNNNNFMDAEEFPVEENMP